MTKAFLFIILLAAFACNYRATPDPINTSELIPSEQISIGGILAELKDTASVKKNKKDREISIHLTQINQLMDQVELLKQQKLKLDHGDFMTNWKKLNNKILKKQNQLSSTELNKWITLNDSLLKYSAKICFADVLEQVAYNELGTYQLEDTILKSFFYTRLYDRIYVNLYGSSSLQFSHTTGGIVRLVQKTNYPYDGQINIKFEIQDVRYIDLFVRIPEWANKASVTVKGVKYNVIPGQFTEIAKKWKNGDEIEIILGLRPIVIKRNKAPKAFALSYGSLFLSQLNSKTNSSVFEGDDPIKHMKFVSFPGKMPLFTFSGIKDTTLVLQPLFAEKPDGTSRTIWINSK